MDVGSIIVRACLASLLVRCYAYWCTTRIRTDMLQEEIEQRRQAEAVFRQYVDQDWLYAAVVQSSNDAIIAETLDGTITAWNSAAERLFGYSAQEAISNKIDILVTPDGQTKLRDILDRAGRGEHVEHFEAVRRHKDGHSVEVSLSVSPVREASGAIVGIAEIARDIGAQKLAEAQFRIAVEASPSGMVMVDPSGTILLVNSELERVFGYSREELVGRSFEMLVPERYRTAHVKLVAEFGKSPTVRRMGAQRDLSGLRKDGTEFPAEIGLNPVQSPSGPLVLAAVVDISERKRAEAAIAAQAELLRHSNAELEQFAYIASHDLQEPLRMVASYTQLLGDRYAGKLDARADKYIRYAIDGAKRMQALVRDLLTYSRISTERRELHPVDSKAVLEAVLERLSAAIEDSQADIVVGSLPEVMSDEGELGQVLQNLVANALKFRSDQPLRIEIAARPTDDGWVFSVADNGIGIDPRYHDRVFQMFQRLHERGKYEGSGIGLAIAKKIVERHEGAIWVESAIEQGTTFYFTMPPASGGSA
ncbi:MAG: PAS domain S-box protein [Xanthobacteraceae bacterium]